jgi:hypothetical protein
VKICILTIRGLLLVAFCAGSAPAFSQGAEGNASALTAFKLVPAEKAAGVARIVGREGTPVPARWYFITRDAAEPNGLREYVAAKGELVAARPISQFVSKVDEGDVLGIANVKVDSDAVAAMAKDYAAANGAPLGMFNYELIREGAEAAPVWKVTCLDSAGKQLGVVVVTATKGVVVSHDGFPVEPKPAATDQDALKLDTYAEQAVAPTPEADGTSAVTTGTDAKTAKKGSSRRRSGSHEEESGVKHAFKKVGGSLQKFFTGKDTINH